MNFPHDSNKIRGSHPSTGAGWRAVEDSSRLPRETVKFSQLSVKDNPVCAFLSASGTPNPVDEEDIEQEGFDELVEANRLLMPLTTLPAGSLALRESQARTFSRRSEPIHLTGRVMRAKGRRYVIFPLLRNSITQREANRKRVLYGRSRAKEASKPILDGGCR